MASIPLIMQLHARMLRDIDQLLLEQLGIGFAQYKILDTLQRNPHTQQKVVAAALGQTEAGVSRQVKLLQEKGLLHADQNPENKREHITDLTFKGEQIMSAATQIMQSYEESLVAPLSEKQQKQFSELLHELAVSTK